jgi:hypothetical protein
MRTCPNADDDHHRRGARDGKFLGVHLENLDNSVGAALTATSPDALKSFKKLARF